MLLMYRIISFFTSCMGLGLLTYTFSFRFRQKKSKGVKSHDRASQLTLSRLDSTRPVNFPRKKPMFRFILLEPRMVQVHIVNFCVQKIRYHFAIANTIYGTCLAALIFEEVRRDDASLFLDASGFQQSLINQTTQTKLCLVAKDTFLCEGIINSVCSSNHSTYKKYP